jgi:hypothetical protein
MGRITSLIAVLCLSAALPLAAQSTQPQSLGDVARQLREQKEKDAKKPAKVITNDNLAAPVPGEAVTVMSGTPATPSTPETSASKPAAPEAETGNETVKPPESKPKTREEWEAKIKAARQDLAKAKEMQQLSEDELNLLQIQEAQEINLGTKADLDAKIQAKQSEVDVNKATTEAAQKALDDLEKEFKDSGEAPDESNPEAPKEAPQS